MRKTPFAKDEYYHVYNRGTNKMNIFNTDFDYRRLQKLLYHSNSKKTPQYSDISNNLCSTWEIERGETLVDISAYCLMPNHFHLLIKVKKEKDASLFLQRILTSHSKYTNKKYNRSGSLFQGKSKTEHVSNDEYLKYLFSYIHLNPIKLIQGDWKEVGIADTNRALEYLSKYEYSSYLDFAGEKRNESKILNISAFPDYFPTTELFEKEIFEWLNYKNDDLISPLLPMSDIGNLKL